MAKVFRLFVVLVCFLAAVTQASRADQTDPRLERLFSQLVISRTQPEIASLMVQINDIWRQSGSDSLDLLMTRASEVNAKGAPEVALAILDEVVDLAPKFAEGWRLRGAVHAAHGDDEEALSDLREALRLEPRHFGALDQIGRLLETQSDIQGALEAYKRLAEIIPQAEGLRGRLQKLESTAPQAQPPI